MLENGRFDGFCVQRIDIFLGSDLGEGSCVDNFVLLLENSRLHNATGAKQFGGELFSFRA